MSKRAICNVHDDILDIIKQRMTRLKYSKDNTTEELVDMIDDLLWYIDDIRTLTEEAIECGQSMENRLKKYREAIENLGFRRDKW